MVEQTRLLRGGQRSGLWCYCDLLGLGIGGRVVNGAANLHAGEEAEGLGGRHLDAEKRWSCARLHSGGQEMSRIVVSRQLRGRLGIRVCQERVRPVAHPTLGAMGYSITVRSARRELGKVQLRVGRDSLVAGSSKRLRGLQA